MRMWRWMGLSKFGLEVNFSKRKYLWLIEYEKFNNFRLCLQQIRSTAINITNSPTVREQPNSPKPHKLRYILYKIHNQKLDPVSRR